MDLAYDHIVEESLPKEDDGKRVAGGTGAEQTQNSLNAEIQDAYKAFSASPWGAKIGGFFGNVVKQGETVYQEAQKELTDLGSEAQRGFSGLSSALINRTRGLSLTTPGPSSTSSSSTAQQTGSVTPTEGTKKDMTTDEALQESETVLSRLRSEAAKRLKDIQKAEDAADEALLRFGTNIRDFLKDAVSITPGSGSTDASGQTAEVLFESKDATGKRVIHTSRFDAQLHVIHTSTESFTKDPATGDWETWGQEFDIASKTEDISKDLEKYPELRATMEKLVPEKIPYEDFWKRYYFLRHGIDIAEARRRDLLKAASAEEEVGWDEDSDDETTAAASPKKTSDRRPGSTESSTTIHPPPVAESSSSSSHLLKPSEPRKSNDERSQPDSDTSYDLVGASSGNPSHAPNSPKEARKEDDSDEDWE
ncbi:BSD-domain-containing protein [Cryphonectria parasitica EP155]|uniref:BSD-domain-containing protein n=1 Tax=Cryphonectria parasitica (strain ATCC 38755 / EP155) TaxID=660469 RepID=A0A9P4XUR6_CRYP1|nr:BSD-domain-containing protein [Cryphonectria parasitica EP155]KAF3761368.1 BSD-domain-containing protein [Cryphonectria parasitica EP155]